MDRIDVRAAVRVVAIAFIAGVAAQDVVVAMIVAAAGTVVEFLVYTVRPRHVAQPPAVLWFTGLSGAGKSTVAGRVVATLRHRGVRVESLDGDVIRDIFPSTGFSKEERDAHVRRVGFLASRLEGHGIVVVAALISPYAESREFVRRLCRNFIEVHVSTPLAECERRDVKGLYARARTGQVPNFTGIDSPYEVPTNPEVVIDTAVLSVDDAATRVLDALDTTRGTSQPARLRSTSPRESGAAGSRT